MKADLTTLGKVIGGGSPIGAYGGRQDLMQQIAPMGPVYQAGTLSGNPLSVAAGIATLTPLGPESPYQMLELLGRRLESGLEEAASDHGIPLVVQRSGSMLTAFFTSQPAHDLTSAKMADTARFARFFHGMLEEGVYWPPSQFEAAFISTAHGKAEIERVAEAARKVFERIVE